MARRIRACLKVASNLGQAFFEAVERSSGIMTWVQLPKSSC